MVKTLIVRHHRIGDALISLPVIISLANKYKEDQFTVISNRRFESIFEIMPKNVTYIPMVSRKSTGIFRGVSFLLKRWLFIRKLKSLYGKFDKIAFLQYDPIDENLHKFVLKKYKHIDISIIDRNKFYNPCRFEDKFQDDISIIGIYIETLSKLGYKNLEIDFDVSEFKKKDISPLCAKLGIDSSKKIISIAPFSKEEAKIYPLKNMEKVVAYFASHPEQYQVIILGGGMYEKNMVEKWVTKYPTILSLIEKVSYEEELLLVAKSDVMLCMDSSNMHLASFLQTPIVSIWGATVPEIGFYPPYESTENTIVKRVDCQPCSFFGNKTCNSQIKYKCLDIKPQIVIEKILNVINTNSL